MGLTKASYSLIQGAVYNVLDFGADNTGATSSKTAIENALDTIILNGGDLFFPSGIYDIGSGVEILKAENFRLFGTKNTVLKLTATGVALNIQNCRNFSIENFKFETTAGVGSTAIKTEWNPVLTPFGYYNTTNYIIRDILINSDGSSTTNSFDIGLHISGRNAESRQNSEMLLEKITTYTNLRGFLLDGGNTENITAISCNAQQAVGVATTNYGWYWNSGAFGATLINPAFSNNLYDFYMLGDAGKHLMILQAYSEGSRYNFHSVNADSSSPYKQITIKNSLFYTSSSQAGDQIVNCKFRGTLVLEGNNFAGNAGTYIKIDSTGANLTEFPLFVDLGNVLENTTWQIDGEHNIRLRLGGALYSRDFHMPDINGRTYIKTGTGAQMGEATLSAGNVFVNNSGLSANSRIFLSIQELGTVTSPKTVGISSKIPGTGFNIKSSDPTDTSVIAWRIIEAT